MTRIICNWPNVPNTVSLEDITAFQSTDIFYHCDTLYPTALADVLQQKGTPRYIVNDNAQEVNIPGYDIYSAPFRGLGIENNRLKDKVILQSGDDLCTRFGVNFCINKKQINRYLAIKLIEIFQINSFTYTWSGIGKQFDLGQIFSELAVRDPNSDIISRHVRYQLGVPLVIKPFFKVVDGTTHIDNGVSISPYGKNFETWNNGLNKIFNHSAVSLITESLTFQHSSVFTEKTLYAIYGLTFPVFVGGYGMIDAMADLGFDVFDDIFDHSYQYKPTLIERCYQAFNFNQHLLRDYRTLEKLRIECLPRLLANRQSLYNGFMSSRIKNKIMQWPSPLQQIMRPYWNFLDQT